MDLDFIIFIINFVFALLYLLLVIRALLPWLPIKALSVVAMITDPFLKIIRLGLPPDKLGVDVSPFVMIIFLWLLQRLLLVQLH